MNLHTQGTIIGPYRIIRVMGEGGCGAVYEAEAIGSLTLPRPVARGSRIALKQDFDTNSLNQIKREFEALRHLEHPNLPHYYDLFIESDTAYLVMELVPGQNLQDVLDKNPTGLPEQLVLSYALQLCDALIYLHSQPLPILHRDIKPLNIRLTPDGLIKLVDFGLVKQGLQQTNRTIRGAGTPHYAPIEQYGQGGSTKPATDIYSLGATLYHLLTGHPPIDACTRAAQQRDPLLSPTKYNSKLSQHVTNALVLAMRRQENRRFQSVNEFRSALLGLGHISNVAIEGIPHITTSWAIPSVGQQTIPVSQSFHAPSWSSPAVVSPAPIGLPLRKWTRGI